MMQYLTMPFQRQMMLCGYKNGEYKKYWGYHHFGIDLSAFQCKVSPSGREGPLGGGERTNRTVLASGNGTVLAAGKDAKLGYGLAVLYPDVYNHGTGESRDLVARYMHLEALSVKAGERVIAGQALGVEGKEGTADYHLHLEFDTDTTPAYAAWSPQVAKGHASFWRNGIDSTVNPSFVLHVGEGQEMVRPTYNPAWLNGEDWAIPAAPVKEDLQALKAENEALRDRIKRAVGILTQE